MKTSKIILALFIAQILCLFVPQAILCQTEKLDIIEYTPMDAAALRANCDHAQGYVTCNGEEWVRIP
jgi:hypothetical protein